MLLRFTKMHGLGNDLMVLDLISQHAYIQPQQMRAWSDRQTGVGFRRLALIEVPQRPDADFSCRVFDAQGAEIDWLASDVCCVARLVADKRLVAKAQMRVELRHAVIDVQVHTDGAVSVPLELPEILTDEVALPSAFIQQQGQPRWLLDKNFKMLSMQGLHAVLLVADLPRLPMVELAGHLEQQASFPRGTTISAVQVQDRNNLSAQVWQLGYGALDSFHHSWCSVAVAAIAQDWVNRQVHIEFASAKARAWLQWSKNDHSVYFTGSATRVYEGQIRL